MGEKSECKYCRYKKTCLIFQGEIGTCVYTILGNSDSINPIKSLGRDPREDQLGGG
jgi:uncharacterized protein (UPF0179 family)